MKMQKLAAICGLLVVLTGCSTSVKFDSTPAGASVVCNTCPGSADSKNGTPIGTTPFEFVVKDIPGWFSEYVFTATKDGYKPATVKVTEKTVLDGTSFDFFPKVIKFDLQK
jgi:hypothetical protein